MLRGHKIFENEVIPLGWKINYLANYYSLVGNRELALQHGLTRQEFVILFCLTHGGEMTAQQVCEVCGRPKNTISRAVSKLLDKGAITKTTHPMDSRAELMHMEPRGHALYEQIIDIFKGRDRAMTAGLTEEEREVLGRLLTKMLGYFNNWTEAREVEE